MSDAGARGAPVALRPLALEEAATAFIRALAHRERHEAGAQVLPYGTSTRVRYPRPLAWPWPVQFDYVDEFFCTAPGGQSVREVAEGAEGAAGAHVVNLFAAQPECEAQPFTAQGYLHAWTSALLARPLTQGWGRPEALEQPTVQGVRIHEAADAQGRARCARLPGISHPGAAIDRFIHHFYATLGDGERDGGEEVVARGQVVVCAGSRVAYLSDLFTHPAHRRKVMHALEAKAMALGATHACLAPGQEVAAFDLYGRKYGYGLAARRAVLVRVAAQG